MVIHYAIWYYSILCSGSDDARVRLAAAKSILRLARRWDAHISFPIFHSVMLMARVCKKKFILTYTIIVHAGYNNSNFLLAEDRLL